MKSRSNLLTTGLLGLMVFGFGCHSSNVDWSGRYSPIHGLGQGAPTQSPIYQQNLQGVEALQLEIEKQRLKKVEVESVYLNLLRERWTKKTAETSSAEVAAMSNAQHNIYQATEILRRIEDRRDEFIVNNLQGTTSGPLPEPQP